MNDHVSETQVLLSQTPLSLVEAGRLADHFTATSTFVRYQERQAKDTLRRHRADLALFTTYLHQIPGLSEVGVSIMIQTPSPA